MFNSKRLLLGLVAVVLWLQPIEAAMAARASAAICSSTTGSSSTTTYGASLGVGDLLFVAVNDNADETTAVTDVSDGTNGSYTLLTGPTDHASTTSRVWSYYYQNNSATTAPTVTVTFDTSIAHRVCIAAFTGAATTGGYDALGTTRTTGANEQTHTSNSVTLSGAGGIISACFFNGTKVATAGSDEINVTNVSTRPHIFFTPHASGTSRNHVATSATNNYSQHVIVAFLEPAGGAATPKGLLLLGAGADDDD